jgi:argininosuccinate lyase
MTTNQKFPASVLDLPERLGNYEFCYENDLLCRINGLFEPEPFYWIDTAWALMLMHQGIIPAELHTQIGRAIQQMFDEEDVFWPGFGVVEKYVIEKCGLDVGGSLTIGRTIPPLRQLAPVRWKLLKLLPMLHDLQESLLVTAEKHADAVMPGYTHVRHAQPITLGHYLMSVYDPMDRVMEEIEHGEHYMALNELGCGALAGTSLPIDRQIVTEYLGLDGIIENANDAVAYTDGYVHLVSALANLMTIWSRMTLDMQYWSGEEYGFLSIPWLTGQHKPQSKGGKGKSHSHFMPNKVDNSPYIERTRVASAELAGQLMELVAMSGRAPHADTHEMLHMRDATERAIDTVHLYLHVWIYALPRMEVHRDRMLAAARKGYSCASELANRIVMEHDLNYRTAHEIVNEMVAEARSKDIPANQVPLSLLEKAAQKVIGRDLGMAEQALRESLDPVHFVEVTDSQGGTAPKECRRMIAERLAGLGRRRERLLQRIERMEQSRQRMLDDLAKISEGTNA